LEPGFWPVLAGIVVALSNGAMWCTRGSPALGRGSTSWQNEVLVMKGVLPLLLSLAIVTASAATPVVECAGTATLGSQHGCCGEQTIVSAPAGTCCLLSQPIRDRALTESRHLGAKEQPAARDVAAHAMWFAIDTSAARRRAMSTSPPGPPAVPIYIQQLALLI